MNKKGGNMYPSPKNLLVYLLLSIVMYTNNNAYSYTRQDTIWYKDYWDSTEVTIDKSDPNGDCEWAKFLLYGDTVGLEINSIMESIFLTKTRIPVDFSKENIIVKYRIKFAYHYINSHATVNVVFDPPPTNEAWWFDPISDSGCGRFHPPVSANYLCNFGPYGGLGGTAGVDDNPQGENLPRESAPYPQNNEWLDITVEMSQYQIITMAIGEFGYTRYETTSCDLSNLTYITPAFGDQQHTWTVVDKIVVIKETEIQNLLKLQSLYAMPGCEVTVPLIMYNSEEVAGVQFVINFEGNYLTPVSVNLGEHASNMDAPWYNTWDDSMKICILSSSGNTIPAGEGTIVEITFLVDSGVPIGDSTLLSLANVIVSDTSAQEIEFVQEDGWIYFATGMKGDVNRDGRIDILDVVRTINIILGDPATDYELWAADVVPPPHGDDVVNVLDAVGIVCMILHEEISSDTSGVTASIEVGEYYDSGSDKLIPVKLTNFGKIMGMELVFAYDPSVTQINDIKLKDRGDRLTLQYATLGDELRVVIYLSLIHI